MHIVPDSSDWSLAKNCFKTFKRKPGSEHIASEFALAHVSAVLVQEKPKRVLEIGAGIGTITNFLLDHPHQVDHITTTENNEFCIAQFKANLSENDNGRTRLVTDLSELSGKTQPFDLFILDGQFLTEDQFRFLGGDVICFVEGSRGKTRKNINERLAEKNLVCNWQDHNQGTTPVQITWKARKRRHKLLPKIRFNKKVKGCWIAKVEKLS